MSLEGVDQGNAILAAPKSGYFVTNNKNLLYMLSAGLVLPSNGFGEKYYQDTLTCCCGWIPLFTSTPSQAALNFCTAEASYLRLCILEVSFDQISGPVQMLSGDLLESRELSKIRGETKLIYVPAPLPLTAIKRILFPSVEDRKACESDIRNYRNVSWAGLKKTTHRKMFENSSNTQWPPKKVPDPREMPFAPVQAAGGIMALLRLMANRCFAARSGHNESVGVAVNITAYGTNPEPMPVLENTVFSEFGDWIQMGRTKSKDTSFEYKSDKLRSLFWQAVDRIVDEGCVVSGNDDERVLLEFLDAVKAEVQGDLQRNVVELQRDMKSLIGLGDIRITEMFEKYKSSFPRSLIVFFLREDSTSLVEFNEPGLNDEDLLAAAVLFGARDGYISLPTALRGDAATTFAISHRMASLSHRIQNTRLDFGEPPLRPIPLVELFLGDWNDYEQASALRIARKQRWDCIQTHVEIGPGEYQMKVKRGGTVFILEGEPKAVEVMALRHKFLTCLAEAVRLNPAVESRILKEVAIGGDGK